MTQLTHELREYLDGLVHLNAAVGGTLEQHSHAYHLGRTRNAISQAALLTHNLSGELRTQFGAICRDEAKVNLEEIIAVPRDGAGLLEELATSLRAQHVNNDVVKTLQLLAHLYRMCWPVIFRWYAGAEGDAMNHFRETELQILARLRKLTPTDDRGDIAA